MRFLNKSIIVGFSALGIALSVNPAMAGKNAETIKSDSDLALDFNEQTHLEFMCNALIEKGAASALNALYVGAFIEELDMLDINQCPKVIVETDNGINDISECGKIYTDKPDIQRLYEFLLEGSENHLQAYVLNIEKEFGEGNYTAQVLTQEQVDALLGR